MFFFCWWFRAAGFGCEVWDVRYLVSWVDSDLGSAAQLVEEVSTVSPTGDECVGDEATERDEAPCAG